MNVVINYWAVLGAAVVSFVISALWFAPGTFAKPWMRSLNINPADGKGMAMGKAFGIGFVSLLLQAYVLAHFAAYAGATTISGAIALGIWVWLGFIAMYAVTAVIYERKSMTWYWISTGYQLVSLIAMSIVLALWK
jgi:hypothetical protein